MPSDCLKDLGEARPAFEHSITERDLKREGPVIARAARLLRQLDVVMGNIYQDNAAMLAAWTSASHKPRPLNKGESALAPAPTAFSQ